MWRAKDGEHYFNNGMQKDLGLANNSSKDLRLACLNETDEIRSAQAERTAEFDLRRAYCVSEKQS